MLLLLLVVTENARHIMQQASPTGQTEFEMRHPRDGRYCDASVPPVAPRDHCRLLDRSVTPTKNHTSPPLPPHARHSKLEKHPVPDTVVSGCCKQKQHEHELLLGPPTALRANTGAADTPV